MGLLQAFNSGCLTALRVSGLNSAWIPNKALKCKFWGKFFEMDVPLTTNCNLGQSRISQSGFYFFFFLFLFQILTNFKVCPDTKKKKLIMQEPLSHRCIVNQNDPFVVV